MTNKTESSISGRDIDRIVVHLEIIKSDGNVLVFDQDIDPFFTEDGVTIRAESTDDDVFGLLQRPSGDFNMEITIRGTARMRDS